ncbi:MAG TPA: hypothetical protein VM553_16670 [Dongiaceae bacterium]|nr:hypothetical protein [Dongiaceae bacterium]
MVTGKRTKLWVALRVWAMMMGGWWWLMSSPEWSLSTYWAADSVCASRLTPAQRAAKEQERAQKRQQKHCARLQVRLDRINRQLDAGYREPRGNELRRQRRELESQIFRECR